MFKWYKIPDYVRRGAAARIALVAIPALMLAGCSTDQLTRFQQGLSNFQSGVVSVNQTIAAISPQLLQNCNTTLSFAQLLEPFAVGSKYNADYQAALSVINTYCQAPPVTNIAGTVALTAQAAANARAAYNAAKNGA